MKAFFGWLRKVFSPRRRERNVYAEWLPFRAGAVLGMAQHQGDLVIACEGGVWRLSPDQHYGFIIEQVLP